MAILKKKPNLIHWDMLSLNPFIFEYNYPVMAKQRNEILLQELMEKVWHPERPFTRWYLDEL
jgi:hypothetical protein